MCCLRRRRCAIALRARKCRFRICANRPPTKRALRRRSRPHGQGGRVRRPDPKIAPAASWRRNRPRDRSHGGSAVSRSGSSAGERAADQVPALAGESERTARCGSRRAGSRWPASPKSDRRTIPADVVLAQEPPPKAAGTKVALLVNRGDRGTSYVMPDLIGVNGDRAAEILRSAASASPSSGRIRIRASPPASSSVRIRRLDFRCPRRTDFARGEPVSVLDRAVDSVGRLRGARRGHRRRRTRRRRSHSRGRDGRPFRAEHHDRAAGRRSRSSASRRVPLEVHLMIRDPDRYIEAFADAGATMMSVHVEVAAAPAPHACTRSRRWA